MKIGFKEYIIIILGILLLYVGISNSHYKNKVIELENDTMVEEKIEEINRLENIILENDLENEGLMDENLKLIEENDILINQHSDLKKELQELENQLPKKEDIIKRIEGIKNDKEMCEAWNAAGFDCITSIQ